MSKSIVGRLLLAAIVALVAVREALAQAPTGATSGAAATAPDIYREFTRWQSIAGSSDIADFEAYLREFPNGLFTALARDRIYSLSHQQTFNFDIVSPQLHWERSESGRPTLVVEGVIRNGANETRPAPRLRATLRAGAVEVRSWTFTATAAEVPAGGEVPYRTEVTDPPPQATTVAVVFDTE
jgi:hypothetical protein